MEKDLKEKKGEDLEKKKQGKGKENEGVEIK